MTYKQALAKVEEARKAGWGRVTIGPDAPYWPPDRDDCFVIGFDPADGKYRNFGEKKTEPAPKPDKA